MLAVIKIHIDAAQFFFFATEFNVFVSTIHLI